MFGGWFGGTSNAEVEDIVRRLEQTRIERELALKEAIIAEARERFQWAAATGVLTIGMSLAAAFYHKNFFYSLPSIPIASYIGYEAHQAVGNKMNIILSEAEAILQDTRQKLSLKSVSIKEIDARITEIISSPEILD
ncbi:Plasminogen receptor [Aphelenchoides besseyi]|nr:Plasminogen receptor [Aphelenchoides besseyi]